ncbi:MAG TPA: D-alanyl-D-alanine carboxypeptidase, partial [Bryocella sp.]|nr:D-alanyl-D-alanine carboxypeptidase [Bryocella sp.]
MARARYAAVAAISLTLLFPAWSAEKKKETAPARLTRDIEAILQNPDASHSFWGVYVISLDSGRPLADIDADKLFTPASNAKLFTTAAVFGLIGPDYRFKTTVETLGTLDKYGRLDSDLVLVGRGDPNLSGRTLPYSLHTERKAPPIQVLQQLADQLVRDGLKYVDGDVVADDSYFVWERYGEGWSQDDLAREWGAPVSALTINDNVLFVNVMPG